MDDCSGSDNSMNGRNVGCAGGGGLNVARFGTMQTHTMYVWALCMHVEHAVDVAVDLAIWNDHLLVRRFTLKNVAVLCRLPPVLGQMQETPYVLLPCAGVCRYCADCLVWRRIPPQITSLHTCGSIACFLSQWRRCVCAGTRAMISIGLSSNWNGHNTMNVPDLNGQGCPSATVCLSFCRPWAHHVQTRCQLLSNTLEPQTSLA